MERTRILLGDRWETRERVLDVVAPWSGEVLAEMACANPDDVTTAVTAAHEALEVPLSRADRAAILDRVAAQLTMDREVFARTIAQEAAKPIVAARAEVDRAVQTLLFSAAEARTFAGEVVPLDGHPSGPISHAYVLREPRGVVAAITPFNFPLNLVAHKVGPAVAAGCPIVLKPAERTPLSAIRLVEAFLEAGLTPSRLQLVTGIGPEVVPPLVTEERVAVVSFTGSAPVGRHLQTLAPHKPVLLELGSAAPLVIERDADLDLAIDRIAAHAFTHAGQSCVSVQRVFVHHDHRDELVTRLTSAVAELTVGDPLDESTDLSCVIDIAAADRIRAWVDAAIDTGASVLAGGNVEGAVVQPTVVIDVPPGAQLWSEEVFAPVVAIRSFTDSDEVISDINSATPVINVGVLTRDLSRALVYVERVRAGAVLVNESPTFRVDHMPYGGDGAAGNTREGPRSTIRELTTEKLVVLRATG